MKSLKIYWFLALSAAVVLAGAAVWLGGVNQDEGWYLYAANLVAEGKRLYADFAYTQGPLMPAVYARACGIWRAAGLLGGRLFTLALGAFGILFAALSARRLAPQGRGSLAALLVTLLLGCNLYHLYYLAMPKSYALASLLVSIGFYLLTFIPTRKGLPRLAFAFVAGLALAYAAGTRVSMGALLAVVGFILLFAFRRYRWSFLGFGIGGLLGLALVYGPPLADPASRAGLLAAQSYHTARHGFDIVWAVGSLSRLVRWYLPLFVILGLCGFRRHFLFLAGFCAVFAVQMLAPFPYEDYQVPIMALLAVFAAANVVAREWTALPLLVLGLAFATAFGSPLLEKWMTNGQDRFWSLKKEKCELAQLRDVARRIEALDPNGRDLLTQDTYLAVETNRHVPKGLEMGPFSILSDEAWRALLSSAPCPVAALSGYTFAVDPPACTERPIERQMEFWGLLKKNYTLKDRENAFGQNATTLLILKRK